MYIQDASMVEIVIKKSRFISYSFRVDNIKQINQYLQQVREQHPDATHVCYAYKVDQLIRFHDANEPVGSAGKPILNIIEKHQLNHILIIVVRYYGGQKLGLGNLIRAYSQSANQVVKLSGKTTPKFLYEITIPYEAVNELEKKLINYQIQEKTINNICNYRVYLPNEDVLDAIKHLFINIVRIKQ